LGYSVPGGNKYRNLALQKGGVSKIETMNYPHEFSGTHLRRSALAMISKN
jgi:ABC-type dipeptide/oligopeptide/nickel transport system ATPase component